MKQAITKHTVFEHFAGRMPPLQRQALEEWMQQPLNQHQYYAWLMEWEGLNLQYDADDSTALHRSLTQLDTAQTLHVPEPTVLPHPAQEQRRWWRGWAAAASVVGLLSLGTYLTQPLWYYKTVKTDYGQVRTIALPDGSTVTLNANSSLHYPRFGFGGNGPREVRLAGEAYFSVTHRRDNERFVVQTQSGLKVVVLGTEFNLYARARSARVVLRRGRVRLVEQVNNRPRSLLMAPGDVVSRDEWGHWARQHTPRPELQSAWQQQRFSFERTTLTDVARLVEETYGLHIVLTDSTLAQRTVSGSFRAQNATEFMSMISQLLAINYRQEDQTITFID